MKLWKNTFAASRPYKLSHKWGYLYSIPTIVQCSPLLFPQIAAGIKYLQPNPSGYTNINSCIKDEVGMMTMLEKSITPLEDPIKQIGYLMDILHGFYA